MLKPIREFITEHSKEWPQPVQKRNESRRTNDPQCRSFKQLTAKFHKAPKSQIKHRDITQKEREAFLEILTETETKVCTHCRKSDTENEKVTMKLSGLCVESAKTGFIILQNV